MRKVTRLQEALFFKEGDTPQPVLLPHTWNNLDGQDGGNDYWRGIGRYIVPLPDPTPNMRQYIEIRGANHIATIWCNDVKLGCHEGGFSTFRFELTEAMKTRDNTLTVDVSNAVSHVYPQNADFTFFGGLYRDVSFIEVEKAHFDLLKDGTEALFVTACHDGSTRADIFPVNAEDCQVQLTLSDREGKCVFAETKAAEKAMYFTATVENPHLWHGVKDPYCYCATAKLLRQGRVLDEVSVTYGYRSFHIDAEQGFFLNDKHTPLHGVCRHQDRLDKGWAISREDHRQDAELIRQIGANTIRLAHYQHDQYFYDLCDEMGFVVWAEVPYISQHIPGEAAHNNIMSQLRELIAQCYNHPSIVVWGIGNELGIRSNQEDSCRMFSDLNALAKKLDPSRMTAVAHLAKTTLDDPNLHISDIQSYNNYMGWYTGAIEDNGPAMDKFHSTYPDKIYGISEYGVENILSWHSAEPFNHDYTEEYANQYHHGLLKAFATRPYLWATHVWNMFDFAADARDEGGVKGRNNKGLITYDRKVKKDAFYIYQAYWTEEPMIHIAGRRFADRAPGERTVTVYTNCPEVTLVLNGKEYATAKASDHAVVFPEVPLQPGENTLRAICGGVSDTIILNGVQIHNASYDLPDLVSALQAGNWFVEPEEQIDYGEDGYTIHMPMEQLFADPRCFDLVKGAVMSFSHINVGVRFKLVSSIAGWCNNPSHCFKPLPAMKTVESIFTPEDIAFLDKLLRGIKRT